MNAASPPPNASAVLISEVGPRYGLQSVARTMATADKRAWITAQHAAGLRDTRDTREQMLDEVRQVVALRGDKAPQVRLEVGLSTVFSCTIQGLVPENEVIALAEQLVVAGFDEVGLSDTTGVAHPAQVRRLFRRLQSAIGARSGAAHRATRPARCRWPATTSGACWARAPASSRCSTASSRAWRST